MTNEKQGLPASLFYSRNAEKFDLGIVEQVFALPRLTFEKLYQEA